jgi:hypothetical protein
LIANILSGRHDWIRTSDLFRVKDVKLRHFNVLVRPTPFFRSVLLCAEVEGWN